MSDDLTARLIEVEREIAEMKRRARNRRRTGTVSEIDLAQGLARVKLMDANGKPYISPWIPWREIAAGGIKTHIPPTVGEQVDVTSESGDLTDATIDMSTPSNSNQRPASNANAVITKGAVRIDISDSTVTVTSTSITFNADNVTYTADSGHLA